MASQNDVEEVLRTRFPDIVVDPLETTAAGRVMGFVISASFDDLDHEERQEMLWNALGRAFAADQLKNVGPIATLTPFEAEIKAADSD